MVWAAHILSVPSGVSVVSSPVGFGVIVTSAVLGRKPMATVVVITAWRVSMFARISIVQCWASISVTVRVC